MSTRPLHPLCWLIPIYLVWAFIYLIFLQPTSFYLSWPDEELYRGAMAKEIIEGLKMPLIDYRPDTYNGGFFVISFLIAIFFKLFGMTLFALKLAPLVFALIALIFWYLAIERTISKNVAILFSIFLIFAPPTFTRYTLWAMGNHPQTIALTGVTLYLFFSCLQSEPTDRKKKMILLGFISGFSLWFSYAFIITLISILLFSMLRARHFFKHNFVLFIVSFIVGFSPWIWINLTSSASGLNIQEDGLLGILNHPMLVENLTHASRFIGKQFWAMCHPIMESPGEHQLIAYTLAVLLIGPVLIWGWRGFTDYFGSFFFLYGVCAAILLQLWPVHAIRIYVTAYPIHLFFIAFGLAATVKAKRLKQCLMVAIPLFAIVSSFYLFSFDTAGHIFKAKGYSYQAIGTAENVDHYLQKGLVTAKSQFTPEDYAELEESLFWAKKERSGLLSDQT